jgi:hypothetical protein
VVLGRPVASERAGQAQRGVRVGGGHGPVEDRPEVVVLAGDPSQPPLVVAVAALLGQVEEEGGVPVGHRLGLSGLGQPLGPIGPQALQQPEPGRGPAHGHHHRPVHQPDQPLQDPGRVQPIAPADRLGRRQGEAA